jgi:hypothetical protein
MQRPLAVVTAAACFLLLVSVMGNLIAIREASPVRSGGAVRPLEPEPPQPKGALPRRASAPLEPAGIAVQADQLAARLLRESALGALGERGSLPYTAETRLLVESKATGRWVTLTEVRVPCADVDRALGRARDRALGLPDRCERWVETTAAVLERHGVSRISAREFLERNEVDTSVRVLLVYAGWRADPSQPEASAALAASGSAAVYPREHFLDARSEALDAIYRELKLGPYAEG